MKKIGFADYYIDEWHANNYIEWFNRANKELGLDYEITYAWAYQHDKEGLLNTTQWCEKNGVTECATAEELCEKSDYILLLAPSDPQVHLMLAEKILPCGKTAYIDKTFADNLENAKKIYELADKFGTKIFSTSALRYSDELNEFKDKRIAAVAATGNGGSLEEYAIHQIEMIVKLMGTEVENVKLFYGKCLSTAIISFDGDRTATLSFGVSGKPYSVDVQAEGEVRSLYRKVSSEYFYNLIKDILLFFENGKAPFDRKETFATIAIRDAIIKGISLPAGTEIKVEK